MIDGIIEGVSTYTRAIKMLSEHNLWRYVTVPGIISVLITFLVVGLTITFAGDLGGYIISYYPWEMGKGILESIASFISALLLIGLVLFIFKYIVMVVIAPFMGTLSEKIESILTGNPPPNVTLTQFINDIVRGLRIATRNIIRELIITGLLLLLNVILPVIGGIISAVLIFLTQAYYAGFGNMDYTLERKRFRVKDSVRFVRGNRGLAIGNGIVFLLIFLIPVIGWFFAPAYGTISATINSIKRIK